ncbi:carbamoyl-phosphate synthase small chain [Clostridia bacterium]|nr:carbamoyl-phosphate synthase small chain [Clostridia bacterium]
MKLYLVLEDGTTFAGVSFGADYSRELIGEAVFTTGMTGYLETLTDKSYAGQIVTQSFPLIGNYGVIPDDFESDFPVPVAYIVKEHCVSPSNFRSEGTLDAMLKQRGTVGIAGIDTRKLIKRIRESGVMNAVITDRPDSVDFAAVRAYSVTGVVADMSVKEPELYRTLNAERTVALLDLGYKNNMVRELNRRGCDVVVLPHDSKPVTILSYKPSGVLLSNGPGDPAENVEVIENLKALCRTDIPVFGICLGHQLLALAHGAKTVKLKYGHRGANQPVRNVRDGRIYVTSQNHGYAVVSDSLPDSPYIRVLFENVNDNTCEGVDYGKRAFSVQFHPEACGGPRDTAFLFDKFIFMMDGGKTHA